jgi:hypothetical protein
MEISSSLLAAITDVLDAEQALARLGARRAERARALSALREVLLARRGGRLGDAAALQRIHAAGALLAIEPRAHVVSR